MSKYYKYDCFEDARLAGEDILKGDGCVGYNCSKYKTCIALQIFNNLEKHAPTNYEFDEAVRRERTFDIER